MKLTSRQDIEAPIDFLYGQLTDFEQFERMALRRGVEVERTDRLPAPGPGMTWKLRFGFRGKPRKLMVKLTGMTPTTGLDYGLDSTAISGTARFELLALSPKRTRMTTVVEIKPNTLTARLMLQSLRLAKGRVQRKFDASAAKLALTLDERWRAAPL